MRFRSTTTARRRPAHDPRHRMSDSCGRCPLAPEVLRVSAGASAHVEVEHIEIFRFGAGEPVVSTRAFVYTVLLGDSHLVALSGSGQHQDGHQGGALVGDTPARRSCRRPVTLFLQCQLGCACRQRRLGRKHDRAAAEPLVGASSTDA